MLSENTRRWIESATDALVVSDGVLKGATSSLLHAVGGKIPQADEENGADDSKANQK